MRKQYKAKKSTCALCKPHKRGWAKRWKSKDRAASPLVELVDFLVSMRDYQAIQSAD